MLYIYFFNLFSFWGKFATLNRPITLQQWTTRHIPFILTNPKVEFSLPWQQIVWGTWCFAESLEEILFGSSKLSHVFYRRYHCSIYFLLHVREEHFWVIVNLLWINKDTIYGNIARFCTGSFSFNFCLLVSASCCVFPFISASHSVSER